MKKAIAVAVLAALSTPAVAAGPWYVYGAVGMDKFEVNKGEIDDELAAITGVRPSSSLDDKDTMIAFQVGYKVNRNFALEAGYYDLGKATYRATFPGAVTATEDVMATGWGLSAVGILPMADKFSLFARLGMIDGKIEETARVSGPGGSASASATATKWKPMYGIGAMYDFTDAVTVRAEYQKFSKLGDENTTGEGDVTGFTLGLMFHF
jgi:OmpA-OmpF porin, OOP family